MAKLDFRLVKGLTSKLAQDLLRQHLDRRGFTDITITDLGSEEFAASAPGQPARTGGARGQPGYMGQNAGDAALVCGQRPDASV